MASVKYFLRLVLLLTLLYRDSSATPAVKKMGFNEEKVKSALAWSIFNRNQVSVYDIIHYDHKFRPPVVNTSLNEPTKVVVSLRDFRIAGFDWTSVTVGFTSKIILEYFDSRLAYKAPEGVNFIAVTPEDSFFVPVWKPSIRFYAHESNRTGFTTHPYPIANQIIVTPKGQVQVSSDLGGIRELRSRKPRKQINEFSLRISIEETMNEVQLVWNKDLPVTFYSPEFEVELPAQANFDLSSEGFAAFERTEDGGFLGESNFSCLLFDFSLSRKDI